MKKTFLILITLLITACGLAFSACGSTPTQRLLVDSSPWLYPSDFTETSVYTVSIKDKSGAVTDTGESITTVSRVTDSTVTLGTDTLEHFTGYVATNNIAMLSGNSQTNIAAFTTNIELRGSYLKIKEGDSVKETISTNDAKKYIYKTSINGAEYGASKTIKHKKFDAAPYIENSMLYMLVRCLPKATNTFTFNVLDTADRDLVPTTARFGVDEKGKLLPVQDLDFNGAKLGCRVYDMSVNSTFPAKGVPYKCYIAQSAIDGTTILDDSDANKLNVKRNINAVAKIIENNVEYTLVSIVNTKVQPVPVA